MRPAALSDATCWPPWSPPVVISVLASIWSDTSPATSGPWQPRAGRTGEAASGGDDEEDSRRVRAFDSDTVLDVSLRAFLERFSQYAQVSPQVYAVAYAYLDQLQRGDAGVRVVRANAPRLLTTAILVASKFVEDRNYNNSHFAAVGGLAAAELGALELHFLFLMQFRLNVCTSVFQSYCCHLEREEASHGAGTGLSRSRSSAPGKRGRSSRSTGRRRSLVLKIQCRRH